MLWFMYILFIISAIVDWLWYAVSVTPFLIISQLSDLNMMLQVRTSYEWTTFLTPTGIPSAAAETYAIKSVENYLTQLDLPDLDKTIVNTLSIIVLWDQLAILRLAKNSSNTAPSQQPDSSSTNQTPQGYKNISVPASVKLSTVTPNMSLPQFRKFCVDWSVCTTITGLPTQDNVAHL